MSRRDRLWNYFVGLGNEMNLDKLKELLQENVIMHDVHEHCIRGLWRAIFVLVAMDFVLLAGVIIALGK